MKLDAASFNGVVAMFEAGRAGLDEIEAIYHDPQHTLTRDDATRVIRYMHDVHDSQAVKDVLDVQVDAGHGAVVRISVVGEAAIQRALEDGAWDTPDTTVIRKARLRSVAIKDFRMRVNMKEEAPTSDRERVLSTVNTVPGKTCRLKRRLSFVTDDGFSVDVTGVRQLASGAALPRYARLRQMPEAYEIEIESVDSKKGVTARARAMALMKHFNVLLKVVDDTDHLMTPADKEGVLSEYVSVAWGTKQGGALPTDPRARAKLFIGPMPVTLEMHHLQPSAGPGQVSVLQRYTVTDKADGERCLLYVASDKRVYIINNRMDVRNTGLTARSTARTVLDGEHISEYKRKGGGVAAAFAGFDAYVINGVDVRALPLIAEAPKEGRLRHLESAVADITGDKKKNDPLAYLVTAKRFEHSGDTFKDVARIVGRRNAGNFPYEVDGMVFTPADLSVGAMELRQPPKLNGGGTWHAVLKWKPPSQNTIDFVVRLRPEDDMVVRDGAAHRVMDLMVGYDPNKHEPITAMAFLTGEAELRMQRQPHKVSTYVERPFAPPGAPADLAVCMLRIWEEGAPLRCENGDEIVDGVVAEFAYVEGKWVPTRVRRDKVERAVATGTITANSYAAALNIWRSIINPVTEDVLCGRKAVGTAEDDGLYYARDLVPDEGDTQPMRKFHNHWVKKEGLLARFKGRARSLFDVGCGRAGDLHKWMDVGVTRVLGIDKSGENLTSPDPKLGAYARILEEKHKAGNGSLLPRIALLPMDATNLIGPAYIESLDDSSGDRTVARVMWGLLPPSAVSNPKLRTYHGFASGGYDLATCMFAAHYFFGEVVHLRNFARNVGSMLRIGGCFVGTCLDGGRVDAALADSAMIEGRSADGARPIWRISRKYETALSDGNLWDASVGKQVDVYMESIGHSVPEYLVDFRLLVAAMAEVGLHPLEPSEATALGFVESTGFFDDMFAEMVRRGDRKVPAVHRALQMSADEKRYSFLNRWFVFVKRDLRPSTVKLVKM